MCRCFSRFGGLLRKMDCFLLWDVMVLVSLLDELGFWEIER